MGCPPPWGFPILLVLVFVFSIVEKKKSWPEKKTTEKNDTRAWIPNRN